MEHSGQAVKAFYKSTNRHAADFCVQLATRYQESYFLRVVLPRYLSEHGFIPPPPAAGAPAVPSSTSAPEGPIARPASLTDPVLHAAWAALQGHCGAEVLPADGYDLTFFSKAHVRRVSPWRLVCDTNVDSNDIVQLYSDAQCSQSLQLHQNVHDGPAVRAPLDVARVPLVKPQFFVRARQKDGGGELLLCAGHPFHQHLVETPRSLEYRLHKPRKMDASQLVLVPAASLLRPLRHYPYFEGRQARAWTAAAPDVPVPVDSPQTPNTWLLSTKIDW